MRRSRSPRPLRPRRAVVPPRVALGLATLWGAAVACAAVWGAGAPLLIVAAAYALYLALPAVLRLAAREADTPARAALALAAALALWLPYEVHALPALPLPISPREDLSKLVALAAGLWLFVAARPLDGVGFGVVPRARDLPLAVGAFAAFAVVALPAGLATGFLAWRPVLDATTLLVRPALIYLLIAVPEEFLFRGLIQNLLQRVVPPAVASGAASVVFGLAHLPDPRYVALAAVAGVAYGVVWRRTGRVAAAAVTHALVDAVWVALLRG